MTKGFPKDMNTIINYDAKEKPNYSYKHINEKQEHEICKI
jgi:hypothetical protein